jgi:hypothetical protein
VRDPGAEEVSAPLRGAWYADPFGSPSRQRWWDGTKWTTQVRDTPSAEDLPNAPLLPRPRNEGGSFAPRRRSLRVDGEHADPRQPPGGEFAPPGAPGSRRRSPSGAGPRYLQLGSGELLGIRIDRYEHAVVGLVLWRRVTAAFCFLLGLVFAVAGLPGLIDGRVPATRVFVYGCILLAVGAFGWIRAGRAKR